MFIRDAPEGAPHQQCHRTGHPQGGPMAQRARPAEVQEGDAVAGRVSDLLWDMEAAWS